MGKRFNYWSIYDDELTTYRLYCDFFFTKELSKLKYLTFRKVNLMVDTAESQRKYSDVQPSDYLIRGLDTGESIINVMPPKQNTSDPFEASILALTEIWTRMDWPLGDIEIIRQRKGAAISFPARKWRDSKAEIFLEYSPEITTVFLKVVGLKMKPLKLLEINARVFMSLWTLFHDVYISETHIVIEDITKQIVFTVPIKDPIVQIDYQPKEFTKEQLIRYYNTFKAGADPKEVKLVGMAFMKGESF